jgi:hypothetical protein
VIIITLRPRWKSIGRGLTTSEHYLCDNDHNVYIKFSRQRCQTIYNYLLGIVLFDGGQRNPNIFTICAEIGTRARHRIRVLYFFLKSLCHKIF